MPERKQRAGISQEHFILHFMRVKKSVVYSQERKIVLVFDLQIKQRQKTETTSLI